MGQQNVGIDIESEDGKDDGSKDAVIAHSGIASVIVSLDQDEQDERYHWYVGNLDTGISGKTVRGAVKAAVEAWGTAWEPAMNWAIGPTMLEEVEPENLGDISTLLSRVPSELLPDVARLLAMEMADAGLEMSSHAAAA